MFRVQHRIGRLVEARVFGLASVDRVEAYIEAFAPVLAGISARPVLCADYRPVKIYSQPVADRLTERIAGFNPVWERIVILIDPSNATFAMQLHRIVRETANPARRLCMEPAEASRFLDEILDPAEQRRLVTFLDEP
jgi:hypothetical protein